MPFLIGLIVITSLLEALSFSLFVHERRHSFQRGLSLDPQGVRSRLADWNYASRSPERFTP
ncbi:hypothetical protein [Asaia astilbis]